MPTQTDPANKPRGATMKFVHPSGSRPLDGYTIKRGVGRGGFGEVYFAESDAGKEVALKLIRRNLDVELRGVKHCLNLKHTNLIGLYDIKTDEMDDRWVVMEYVSGESLEEVVDRNPNGLPEDEALRWMYGICAGVAYLHDHGIVHRDLKPGNIFTDEGVVKIGDYGLAKFISCSRRSGQTESVGTIHYMAPEIANGRYGREIDTYALGVMLYEILTGDVPFKGESVGEVLMKHLTAEPELDALEEPYRSIVASCLAKDPDKRLGSVAELLELLPPPPAGSPTEPIRVSTKSTPRDADRASYSANVPDPQPPQPGTPHPNTAQLNHSAKQIPEAIVLEDTPELVQAVAVEEWDQDEQSEPIARAVKQGFRNVASWWDGIDIEPGPKTLLLVGVCVAAFLLFGGLIGPLVVAGVFYGIYWVFWWLFMVPPPRPKKRHNPHPANPPSDQAAPAAAKSAESDQAERAREAYYQHSVEKQNARQSKNHLHRRSNWPNESRGQLAKKTLREKITEITGSMLIAALVAITMSFVALALCGLELHAESLAWLALVGTLGAWLVILPSKLWESRKSDDGARRFVMLAIGLMIGAIAWLAADVLMFELTHGGSRGLVDGRLLGTFNPANLYAADGTPLLLAYTAYFGFLFVLLRWWRMADPLRTSRLNLWTTIWCVGCAWLLSLFWLFPQPWAIMLAAIISVSVQLASPWIPLEERTAEGLGEE